VSWNFIGACLLWVGWFGFNAGSALAAGAGGADAFVATHFAASGGGGWWAAAEWLRQASVLEEFQARWLDW
jgi:Amt family ammonium transporter